MSWIKTFVSRGASPIQLATLTRALAPLIVLAAVTTLSQAQGNFTVLHNFTYSGPGGTNPESAPTLDGHGNLYGTTLSAGTGNCLDGCGTVYELRQVNGSWIFNLLYGFSGQSDGGNPHAGVTIGPDGTLYGAASDEFADSGHGTVFNVKPPANVCHAVLCPWTDTTLHSFAGGYAGANPQGNVVFDAQGNLYGTTLYGGMGGCVAGCGTIYRGTASGGVWTISTIHSFAGNPDDGALPMSGMVVDSAGNLYGTTQYGGTYGFGTVYELSPSGEGWTQTLLYSFTGYGGREHSCLPNAGLVFDQAGNLYGATLTDSECGPPIVFELSPQGGGWNFTTIYTLHDPYGPEDALAIDSAGNLYGTTVYGGSFDYGTVFELSPSSGGGWTYTNLFLFSGGIDGENPNGVVVTGPGGYLYGTTGGGTGVIFQINLGAH